MNNEVASSSEYFVLKKLLSSWNLECLIEHFAGKLYIHMYVQYKLIYVWGYDVFGHFIYILELCTLKWALAEHILQKIIGGIK